VRPATEFTRVVADFNHTDLVAVLLPEESHRAQPARFLLGGDERVNLEAAQENLRSREEFLEMAQKAQADFS
jgi:hypothetical protein